MDKQIIVDGTIKESLCKDFGVTRVTLWSALTFKTQGGKANMLRKAALERGGVLVDPNNNRTADRIPMDFETTFQTADKTMTQVFSDRVKIVLYQEVGRTVVLVDNEPKMTSDNLSIAEFMALQQEVQRVANGLKKL